MNEIISKAIPPGSSIYYSLRFLEPAEREAISLLYAFSQEIEDIVSQRENAEVAQRKLDWWLQELQQLANVQPSHPLTKALLPIINGYQIPSNILTEVVTGIGNRLANPNYTDFKNFSEQHYRAISCFPLLVSLITMPNKEQRPLKFIHDLGIALQIIEVIHDLRCDLQHGYIYLPEQDMAKYAVAEHELLALKASINLKELLQELAQHARSHYQQALTKLDASQQAAQLPSLILAKLYFKLLDEIEKDQFNVLRKQVILSPLRKLWLSWRTYISFITLY